MEHFQLSADVLQAVTFPVFQIAFLIFEKRDLVIPFFLPL
jgi:hypothetical protein